MTDFSKILDEWENRGGRKDQEPFDKDEAAAAKTPPPPRSVMEKTPVEDSLDLHGMRQDEAVAALRYYLRESRLDGRRKVLVIHGKGFHSENKKGVLGDAVRQVLVKDRNVAAWGEADRKDGGRGAAWVWLTAPGK